MEFSPQVFPFWFFLIFLIGNVFLELESALNVLFFNRPIFQLFKLEMNRNLVFIITFSLSLFVFPFRPHHCFNRFSPNRFILVYSLCSQSGEKDPHPHFAEKTFRLVWQKRIFWRKIINAEIVRTFHLDCNVPVKLQRKNFVSSHYRGNIVKQSNNYHYWPQFES